MWVSSGLCLTLTLFFLSGKSLVFELFSFFVGIVELPEDQFLDVFVCNITGTYDIYLRLVGEEYSVRSKTR